MTAGLRYQQRSFLSKADVLSAEALLELWRGGGAQHVASGAGCACGADGVLIQLVDFEQDIVDYLRGEAERMNESHSTRLIDTAARRDDGRWSIELLLGSLSDLDEASREATFLLPRLSRSLESFSRRHRFVASAS